MNSFIINNIEYVVNNTLEDNYFVGIKVIDNKFHLYFPIGYELKEDSESYLKNALRHLYKTVMITKSIELDKDYEYKNESEKTIPMNSYVYILSDYFSCGVYRYVEKKYRNDTRGKINWKRTFKNSFYMQSGSPIYLNSVVQYNKKETNIITMLQLYCVNKAIDMLTFLGDFNRPFSELKDIDIINNISYYNNLIDSEIRNTNNDKMQLLLMNIKNIINDCNDSGKYVRSFGTVYYQYSFEKMINSLFGNVANISEYYPTAFWNIDEEKPFESSKLRQDTIWKGKDIAIIIDSKYYRYGVENSNSLLPNTKAIYKQIVYGDYVKKKLKKEENIDYNIYNVFVIPSDHNEFVEYKGNAKMKLLDDSETQKTVHLCLINMNDVVDKYFSKECGAINDLIKKISENNN